MECGEQEVVTNEERKENRDFIDAIMETDVMQEAHRYLVEKNKAPKDEIEFKRLLYKTWFSLVRLKATGPRATGESCCLFDIGINPFYIPKQVVIYLVTSFWDFLYFVIACNSYLQYLYGCMVKCLQSLYMVYFHCN